LERLLEASRNELSALNKKNADLHEASAALGMADRLSELDMVRSDLRACKTWVAQLEKDAAEAGEKVEELRSDLAEVNSEEDKLRKSVININAMVEALKGQMDKNLAAKHRIEEEEEEWADFQGGVPEELLAQRQNWSAEALRQDLKKCDTKLKRMSAVNKLVVRQAEEMREALADFNRRRQIAEDDLEKLEELLDSVEEKRQSKVHFTYNQVNKYFGDIFSKLAPEGEASLTFVQSDPPSEFGSGGDSSGSLSSERSATASASSRTSAGSGVVRRRKPRQNQRQPVSEVLACIPHLVSESNLDCFTS